MRIDRLGLAFFPLRKTHVCCLVPFGHPLAMAKRASLETLSHYPLYTFSYENAAAEQVAKTAQNKGITLDLRRTTGNRPKHISNLINNGNLMLMEQDYASEVLPFHTVSIWPKITIEYGLLCRPENKDMVRPFFEVNT